MDGKKLGAAIISYFSGVFLMMIMPDLMTSILDILNTGTNAIGDTNEGIIWIGVILFWALLTIVIPAFCIHTGLRTDKKTPQAAKIVIGSLIFFFSILITYQAWFMIQAIADSISNTSVKTFFWIGFIINWGMLTIITPLYLIIDKEKLPTI